MADLGQLEAQMVRWMSSSNVAAIVDRAVLNCLCGGGGGDGDGVGGGGCDGVGGSNGCRGD